jgi:hypothetical protein
MIGPEMVNQSQPRTWSRWSNYLGSISVEYNVSPGRYVPTRCDGIKTGLWSGENEWKIGYDWLH